MKSESCIAKIKATADAYKVASESCMDIASRLNALHVKEGGPTFNQLSQLSERHTQAIAAWNTASNAMVDLANTCLE